MRERLLVKPGARPQLASIDPRETFGRERASAEGDLQALRTRLEELQDRLWAGDGGALLVVLQGIDTSGKDGTLRHVMTAFNPQGCTVTLFGVPTPQELAHDYLWRVHQHTPARGTVSVFDRSHYEDVLVVRVHELVPKEVWSRRYDQINRFEEHLAANGTTIVKFFLHISREEQRERLQARIDTPEKRWKFRLGDLDERKRWDEYMAAYEEVLDRCSTEGAPWYIIPADRKWFRNLAVAEILVATLDEMGLSYPPAGEGIVGLVVE
ncbi:MAG: polyphosphate kinase 2 family protein [Chloroflexi bacterium]|nr:polyphosphate kinase 2 family protein [Chloroflexota bacterium]